MSNPILHGMPISRLLLFFLARHRKNREAASELLMRLKDNRDLQKFLQDCQEVNYLLSVVSLKHPYPLFVWSSQYLAIKPSKGI